MFDNVGKCISMACSRNRNNVLINNITIVDIDINNVIKVNINVKSNVNIN